MFKLVQLLFSWIVEIPARRATLPECIEALDRSGRNTLARLEKKRETPTNRDTLCHIIGIERWGQRRLQTLLGEPALQDEYDGYRPESSLDMNALRNLFGETREASLALARQLAQQNIAATSKVKHNDIGELTVKGWLRYLRLHAAITSLLME